MNEKIATNISRYLVDSEESLDYIKIKYYLESMLGEIEKFILILIIFSALGYGIQTLIVMTVMFLLRPYTGGTHFNSYWMCFGYTMLMCTIINCIGVLMPYNTWSLIIAYILMLIAIVLFVPIKSEYRPVYVGKIRMKMKLRAMISLVLTVGLRWLLENEYKIFVVCTLYVLFIDLVASYTKVKKHSKNINK